MFCYISDVVLDLYVGIKTCLFTTGLYSLYDIQLYSDLSRQQHNRVNDTFYRLDCSFIFLVGCVWKEAETCDYSS